MCHRQRQRPAHSHDHVNLSLRLIPQDDEPINLNRQPLSFSDRRCTFNRRGTCVSSVRTVQYSTVQLQSWTGRRGYVTTVILLRPRSFHPRGRHICHWWRLRR